MKGGTPWLGHGRTDDQHHRGEPDGERERVAVLDPHLERARAGAGGAAGRRRRRRSRPAPAASTGSPARGRGGARGRSSNRPRSPARKRIQAKQTRLKVANQRSQAGVRRPTRPSSACSADQPCPVEGAPEHERPGGPVPEPAEQHRDHQVAVGASRAAAVAAERDVEVVAQEARQGHVPAPPEVAEAGRPVGAVEVLREDEAHQQRQPDRHVGVAGEVAVDLRRIAVGGEQRVGR